MTSKIFMKVCQIARIFCATVALIGLIWIFFFDAKDLGYTSTIVSFSLGYTLAEGILFILRDAIYKLTKLKTE